MLVMLSIGFSMVTSFPSYAHDAIALMVVIGLASEPTAASVNSLICV